MPLSLFTAQYNNTISPMYEYHHHPSARHLAIHQDISLDQKIVHVHYSENIQWSRLFKLFEEKRTLIIFLE